MKKAFVPETLLKCQNDLPRLLIIDGHNSHTHYGFLDYANQNNVIVLCLPPHTTHKLQPCDVGVFGPLANAWKNEVQKSFAMGHVVTKYNLIEVYSRARLLSFKPTTIQAAFKTTGIWPFNRDVLGPAAYLPAEATTTRMNLPGPAATLLLSSTTKPATPSPAVVEFIPPSETVETVGILDATEPSPTILPSTAPARTPASTPQPTAPIAIPPSQIKDLSIPSIVTRSRVPALPPCGADQIDIWEALLSTRQTAIDMAKHIETLTSWCKLYATENAMLRNLVHGKKRRPKEHFLPGRARVLTYEEQLEAIKKQEDDIRKRAEEKAAKAKAKAKGRAKGTATALARKHAVWEDDESDSGSDTTEIPEVVQDNDDYEPATASPNQGKVGTSRPQRARRAPLAIIQQNSAPNSNALPAAASGVLAAGSKRAIRATRGQKNSVSSTESPLPMQPCPKNATRNVQGHGDVVESAVLGTGDTVQGSRPRRNFKRPNSTAVEASNESVDDFFIRNPAARSSARIRGQTTT